MAAIGDWIQPRELLGKWLITAPSRPVVGAHPVSYGVKAAGT
jgi:hypothetical protein